MKLALRCLMAAVAVAGLVFSLHRYCIRPVQCARTEVGIEAATRRALASEDSVARARQNLRALSRCADVWAMNVNYYMLSGVNLAAAGESPAAIRMYEKALSYDRRPEIYINLGYALLDLGDSAAAQRAFVSAGLLNPSLIDKIAYDDLRRLTRNTVDRTFSVWSRRRH